MKINIIRAILIVLLLTMFSIIFGFSSQDAEKSSSVSRGITETVTKNINSIQKMEKSKKEQVLDKIEHYIRKLAHFSLYMIVGILMMSLMSTYNLNNLKRYSISVMVGLIYAISDECHQIFIAGRAGAIGDVLIDTCGVIVGGAIVFLVLKFTQKLFIN